MYEFSESVKRVKNIKNGLDIHYNHDMIWERKQERQNEQEAVYLPSQVCTPHG